MEKEIPQIWSKAPDGQSKVIQLYLNGKPYLWHAQIYHADILSSILDHFEINYKFEVDKDGLKTPLDKDETLGYELIGAGRAEKISEKVTKYYDGSGSYPQLQGMKLKHLEDVFKNKKVNITVKEDRDYEPVFLVEELD